MSFIVSGYVIKNRPQGLSKAETLTQPEAHLLLILSSHGNDNGGGIWPSYNTIALSMKCDRRTVISWMNSLIKKKYVIKKGQTSNNKSLTNQYYINVNRLRAETCQKPQQFDDEMNPFEAEVVVIHDHHRGDPRSPQGCSTITPPVIHDHPNSSLSSIEKKLASSQPLDKVSAEQKEAVKAQLLAWQEAEALKMKGRAPRDEVEAEPMPSYQPEPTMPIAPDDAPLMKQLREAGIGDGNIRAVLRIYTDRRQITQALDKLAVRQAKGAVKNPEALFMTIVKDPYQPPKASKADEERAARLNQEAIARRKDEEAAVIGDQLKEANVVNRERTESRIEEMRRKNKEAAIHGRPEPRSRAKSAAQ
jgi:hypothetical protein